MLTNRVERAVSMNPVAAWVDMLEGRSIFSRFHVITGMGWPEEEQTSVTVSTISMLMSPAGFALILGIVGAGDGEGGREERKEGGREGGKNDK